jgi:hypothetical protein
VIEVVGQRGAGVFAQEDRAAGAALASHPNQAGPLAPL